MGNQDCKLTFNIKTYKRSFFSTVTKMLSEYLMYLGHAIIQSLRKAMKKQANYADKEDSRIESHMVGLQT